MSFFFQAEDGIRDYKVTGVQTCALPILIRRLQRTWAGVGTIQSHAKRVGQRAGARDRVHDSRLARQPGRQARRQIGRASCRERVWMEEQEGAGQMKGVKRTVHRSESSND